ACNLVLSTAGAMGMQVNAICGEGAVRRYGLLVGGTGLLNLALSILAARAGSPTGVAVATNIAQLILTVCSNWYVAPFLGQPRSSWLLKTCVFPTVAICLAALLRLWISPQTILQIAVLLTLYALIFVGVCVLAGFNWRLLRSELTTLRSMARPT